MDNLEHVLTPEQFEHLKKEQQKLDGEQQDEIIKQSHGTLVFEEIIRINNALSKRIKIDVDLRNRSLMAEEEPEPGALVGENIKDA